MPDGSNHMTPDTTASTPTMPPVPVTGRRASSLSMPSLPKEAMVPDTVAPGSATQAQGAGEVATPPDLSGPVAPTLGRRRPSLAQEPEALAPVVPEAERREAQSEALPSPAIPPGGRRRSSLDGISEPLAPDAERKEAAPDEEPPAPGPKPENIIGADQAPKDADGLPLYPDHSSATSAPPGPSPDSPPVDGEAASTGGEPGPVRDEKPGDIEIKAQDPLHASMIEALLRPRQEALSDIEERMSVLEAERQAAAQRVSMHDALEAQKAAMAARGQGGPGSFLGGVGAGIAALGRRIGGDPVASSRKHVSDISAKMENLRTYRNFTLDRHYRSMVETADTMYKSHLGFNDKVSVLNARLAAHPDGNRYLGAIQAQADRTGVDVSEVRRQVHDAAVSDPAIMDIRSQASRLASDPVLNTSMGEVEDMSRMLTKSTTKLHDDIRILSRRDVDMSSLDGQFSTSLEGMKVKNADLARPGGAAIDQAQEQMKTLMEQIQKMLASIRNAVMSLFARKPG